MAITVIVSVALVVRRLIAGNAAANLVWHVLDKRYARREIGRDEYEQKRRGFRG